MLIIVYEDHIERQTYYEYVQDAYGEIDDDDTSPYWSVKGLNEVKVSGIC